MRVLPLALFLVTLAAAEPVPAAAGGASAGDLQVASAGDLQVASAESPAGSDGAGEADAGPGDAAAQDAQAPAVDGSAADGWIVDEESGRRYRIEKLENLEGLYSWVDEDTVRFRHGVHFDVVDYDDDWLWVKVYAFSEKVSPERAKQEAAAAAAAAAAEREQVAEMYRVDDIPAVDRLQLQGFDTGLPKSGQWRQGFDVADMNGDGHLDIVFGPPRKAAQPQPNIFLGDGRGTWRWWREARFPRLPYDYGDAATGDLDGDGHMDLVLGVHLRGLLALVGDGEGGFSAWSTGIPIDHPGKGGDASAYSSRAVELFDWNGDGRLDIVALGEGPKGRKSGHKGAVLGEILNTARGLAVFINHGDGTWTPQRPGDTSVVSLQFGDSFALADFNRDGFTDVVLASRIRNSRNLVGIGTQDGAWESQVLDPLRRSAFFGAVAAADYDRDGFADFFLGYQSSEADGVQRTGIDIYSSDKDLNWQRRPLIVETSRRAIYAIDTGDLDGDGRLDLVALTGDGDAWIFLGDDKGFVREQSPELPPKAAGCRGYALRLRDLDGDGRDELIAGFAGETTGLPGIQDMSQPGCRGEGSLRVWKTVDIAEIAPARTEAGSRADPSPLPESESRRR